MNRPTLALGFGAGIFGVLACNTGYYIIAGRFSEALESVAWYALLILFLLETARAPPLSARVRTMNHALRALATLAIAAAAVLYVREQEWLDAANLFLWLAVVALLEIEVRRPVSVATNRQAYTLTAALIYSALGVLVLVWLTRGEWMDAWDAAWWLAAFGLLERDLLLTKEIAV